MSPRHPRSTRTDPLCPYPSPFRAALGTHVAALGLTFSDPQAIPASFSEGAFIGEHGSFNRNPPAGYKVVFVPFRDGKPSGNPVDFLSDFVDKEGNARGRRIGRAAWRERGWQDV